MSTIATSEIRIGRFTSSEIHRLCGFGKDKVSPSVALESYAREKAMEKRLGRPLSLVKHSRATLWGNFVEARVHELLDTSYSSAPTVTIVHPEYDFWAGSPDNRRERERVVCDTKCYEPENFACYVDMLTLAQPSNNTDLFKKEYAKEYWQLVSNACILGFDKIEAIVYMPYFSELEEIRMMAQNYEDHDAHQYRFIYQSPYYELPYLPDNGHYKNLNIFQFEVPQSDKDFLTSRVVIAGELLNKQ